MGETALLHRVAADLQEHPSRRGRPTTRSPFRTLEGAVLGNPTTNRANDRAAGVGGESPVSGHPAHEDAFARGDHAMGCEVDVGLGDSRVIELEALQRPAVGPIGAGRHELPELVHRVASQHRAIGHERAELVRQSQHPIAPLSRQFADHGAGEL